MEFKGSGKSGKTIRAEVVDNFKKLSSGYNRTDVHMNSKILWHQAWDIHRLKTNEVPVLIEEGRNRLPPLTCN